VQALKSLSREQRDLVMSVSNPCQLRINGVLCGFTSADPLLHMCSAIYARSAEQHPHSLIAEAAARIIEQQVRRLFDCAPLPLTLDAAL
jgi:hypothetical protein